MHQSIRLIFGLSNTLYILCAIIFYKIYNLFFIRSISSEKLITNYSKIQKNNTVFFCGGGWRVFYHIGVYKGLKSQNPEWIANLNYIGRSMGSFIAVLCACNLDFDDKVLPLCFKLARRFETDLYNNIFSMGKQLREILEDCLPPDAYKIVSGKCFIVITTVTSSGLQQEIISEFYSQHDLLNAITASIFIPIWTDTIVYRYRNNICLDGSVLDLNQSICNKCIKVIFDDDNSDIKQSSPITVKWLVPPTREQINDLISMGIKDSIEFYEKNKDNLCN